MSESVADDDASPPNVAGGSPTLSESTSESAADDGASPLSTPDVSGGSPTLPESTMSDSAVDNGASPLSGPSVSRGSPTVSDSTMSGSAAADEASPLSTPSVSGSSPALSDSLGSAYGDLAASDAAVAGTGPILRPILCGYDGPPPAAFDDRDALPIHNDRRYYRALLPFSAGLVDETRAWQELVEDAARMSLGSASAGLVDSLRRDYEALWEAGATLADLDLAKPWRAQVDAIVRGEGGRGAGGVPQKQGRPRNSDSNSDSANEGDDGADWRFASSDAAITDDWDERGLILRPAAPSDNYQEAPVRTEQRRALLAQIRRNGVWRLVILSYPATLLETKVSF